MRFILNGNVEETAVVSLRQDEGEVDIILNGVLAAFFSSDGTLNLVQIEECNKHKLAGMQFNGAAIKVEEV